MFYRNSWIQSKLQTLIYTGCQCPFYETLYLNKCVQFALFFCVKSLRMSYRNTGSHEIQSTLVISNSKGLSEILRDIRPSTYQICRIDEKLIRLTTFNKIICVIGLLKLGIENILGKRRNCSFLLFSTILLHVVRFSCLGGDQIFTSR